MKLEKILDKANSLEKNSFIKIVDNIITNNPKNSNEIEKLLNDTDKGLKKVDNVVISKIFNLVEDEFSQLIQAEFVNTSSQLDILSDIIIRDGNSIMKSDWFTRLYENELKNIKDKIKELQKELENEKSAITEQRKQNYKIYKACLHTAFYNDLENNRDVIITNDELSILLTLSHELELSQEEVKLINYMIVPVKKMDIDFLINDLKNIGVIFYFKKNRMILVADELVRVMRKIRKKEVADKFFRRVLRLLREPQINLICKKYNIDRKLLINEKIKKIIHEGISFSKVLINDIHRGGVSLTEKKMFLNEICNKGLNIKPILKGTTLEDKISNLIKYFETIEKDEKVGISIDGYEKMVIELREILPKLNNQLRTELELQNENVLRSNYLLDFNIKPRDILEIIPIKELEKFCKAKDIKTRGNIVNNILDTYKDSENLYLENYESIGFRNMNVLKENGIRIKESELGIKFEDLTKTIFCKLGFNIDDKLKKKLNTKKDKIDIVINLGNNKLILIECKTIKESGYNKFSSVSRQMKAYTNLAIANDYNVIKTLLIAPDFSDAFVNDCELEYELNLSLITASSLITILKGFKNSKKHKQLPYKLLLRDVLIQSERILKAIK